jgi:hypothetical protein
LRTPFQIRTRPEIGHKGTGAMGAQRATRLPVCRCNQRWRGFRDLRASGPQRAEPPAKRRGEDARGNRAAGRRGERPANERSERARARWRRAWRRSTIAELLRRRRTCGVLRPGRGGAMVAARSAGEITVTGARGRAALTLVRGSFPSAPLESPRPQSAPWRSAQYAIMTTCRSDPRLGGRRGQRPARRKTWTEGRLSRHWS